MSEETTEITDPEPTQPEQAAPAAAAPARLRYALIGAAAALIVVAAAAGGVVAGHELWSSSHSTNAAVQSPSVQNPGFGGGGSFGNGGSGSSGSSSSATGVEAKVNPALVNINVNFSYQGASGAGTGIVVSSDGEVLTNNHVIDGATTITATDVGNGKTYDATVVGYDPAHDVAVLQLKDASGLQTVKLGDSDALQVGDSVVGIGNAGGAGGTPTSATGTITALNQSITAGDELGGTSEKLSGLIETNANIQPGDSGGPLVNSDAEVVGMNTAGSVGFSGFGFQGTDGGAFAIPINDVTKIALSIVTGKASDTVHIGDSAFLGITVQPAGSGSGSGGFGFGFGGDSGNSSVNGLQVGSVVDGQAAQKAGLQAGDVITSFDGQSVGSTTNLSASMLKHHPGDVVKLGWVDASGSSHSASVTLGSGPAA